MVAQEGYLAVMFIMNSDKDRYGDLLVELENDFLKGSNEYPKTMMATYNLLVNWKQEPQNMMGAGGEDVLAAEDIFGPNLGSLKGKTV